ncbi:hypothetical protein PCI56_14245 [Plesiomonas shigelloides subsp. oncorhynchi]|nr:hypothetical protein [Plesiomonas shigelloides]
MLGNQGLLLRVRAKIIGRQLADDQALYAETRSARAGMPEQFTLRAIGEL